MVLNVCGNVDLLYVLSMIRGIVGFMKIIAPVILIIMSMVDVLRAVISSNQEQLSKNLKRIPNRIMICAVILLLPTIFEFVIDSVDSSNQSIACFQSATSENVQVAYQDLALTLITRAEEENAAGDYNKARLTLAGVSEVTPRINDEMVRSTLIDRARTLETQIENNNRIVINTVTVPDYSSSTGSTGGGGGHSFTIEGSTGGGGGHGFGEYQINNRTFINSPRLAMQLVSVDEGTFGGSLVMRALNYLGVPYVYGGNDMNSGIDCSGFTQQLFAQYNVSIPRTANAQGLSSQFITVQGGISNAKPGDLLFYPNNSGGYRHVAIYAGLVDGVPSRIHASGGGGCPNRTDVACEVVLEKGVGSDLTLIKRLPNT